MNHETHEKHEKKQRQSNDNALVFDLGAKIDQQAKFVAGGFQVVVNLCAVEIIELLHGLDLHDNGLETDEIGQILCFNSCPL
jgi:hypothetical protein